MTFASILEATGLSAVPVLLFLKATCLLLAAMGATFVMMRASSGARHLVWLVVLSSLLLLPVFAMWRPLRLEVLPRALATRETSNAGQKSGAVNAESRKAALPGATPTPAPSAAPLANDAATPGSPRSMHAMRDVMWLTHARRHRDL